MEVTLACRNRRAFRCPAKPQRREGKGPCLTDVAHLSLFPAFRSCVCRYAMVRTCTITLSVLSAEVASSNLPCSWCHRQVAGSDEWNAPPVAINCQAGTRWIALIARLDASGFRPQIAPSRSVSTPLLLSCCSLVAHLLLTCCYFGDHTSPIRLKSLREWPRATLCSKGGDHGESQGDASGANNDQARTERIAICRRIASRHADVRHRRDCERGG